MCGWVLRLWVWMLWFLFGLEAVGLDVVVVVLSGCVHCNDFVWFTNVFPMMILYGLHILLCSL